MQNNSEYNLVIDVGNTLTKVAIFNGNNLVLNQKHKLLTPNIIEDLFSQYAIKRSIISNVGKDFPVVNQFLSDRVKHISFSTSIPVPIKICYKTPSTLGPDRLAAAVAANALYPNHNVLTIDCGTAITFDLVTEYSEYLGGAISLGIATRFKALNYFTQSLPLLEIANDYPLVGNDTQSSILSGVLNGIVNEVDGYINSVKEQYSPLKIVFTGGESFFFDKKLKNSIFVQPNLVLVGLNRILNYNE